jgi:hypothetical protein
MRRTSFVSLTFCGILAVTLTARAESRASQYSITDAEVIEALLIDLLDDKSFCCAYPEPKPEDAQIVVDLMLHPDTAFGLLRLNGSVRGFVDQNRTIQIPSDIRVELKRRNKGKGFLMPFKPLDKRILAIDLRKERRAKPSKDWFVRFDDPHPKAKAYVWVALPGYSHDGAECVIRFTVGPSSHGTDCTALLRQEMGTWKVASRNIERYL